MKVLKSFLLVLLCAVFLMPNVSKAEKEHYVIDTEKAHAFIEFKISHLGYSWLLGRFNKFEGEFDYDTKDPSQSSIFVKIYPASVDTNFALRDKHIRGEGLLEVDKFKRSSFKSKSIKITGDKTAIITGDFTLHGVTKEIEIKTKEIGKGKDPWGGYRRGFEGTTKFALKDFNIKKDLGPASNEVELFLSIEGIRQ